MYCPHCSINVHLTERFASKIFRDYELSNYLKNVHDSEDKKSNVDLDDIFSVFEPPISNAYRLLHLICPSCNKLSIVIERGKLVNISDYREPHGWVVVGEDISPIISQQIIYPLQINKNLRGVPDRISKKFHEAISVISLSPAACAALCRMLLQDILQNYYGIRKKNLNEEIIEFLKLPNIPSILSEEIDNIRIIGNFAAHPKKCTNVDSIIEVEPGEAEWSVQTLENLLDFAFTQPIITQERKDKLSERFS